MLKDIKNIIIIVLVITNILVYFLGNRDKQLLVDKITEVYKLEIVENNKTHQLALQRDKEIIDTLINKLDRKTTYQINNDLTKTKAKKNSNIKIDLNNKIVSTETKEKESKIEPVTNNVDVKKRRKWYQIFKRRSDE